MKINHWIHLAWLAAIVFLPLGAAAQTAQESGYVLDYKLDIKAASATGNFSSGTVPYSVDNSASIATGSFTRVAYELTLSGSTNTGSPNGNVWVSFVAPSNNASKLGVPSTKSGEFYQQAVSNMNVIATGSSSVVNATGLTNGNIQFWPSNYGQNSITGNYDWNDNGAGTSQGYGSMQISQIIAANGSTGNMFESFNNWSSSTSFDVGLGNSPSGTNPNYTFRGNVGDYTSEVLTVWVTPEPASLGFLALGGVVLLGRRRIS